MEPKRSRGLIPEPGEQLAVEGLRLPVPLRLRSLPLAAFGRLITRQGLFRGVGFSWRAKGWDRNSSSPGWGTRSEHLKVHFG